MPSVCSVHPSAVSKQKLSALAGRLPSTHGTGGRSGRTCHDRVVAGSRGGAFGRASRSNSHGLCRSLLGSGRVTPRSPPGGCLKSLHRVNPAEVPRGWTRGKRAHLPRPRRPFAPRPQYTKCSRRLVGVASLFRGIQVQRIAASRRMAITFARAIAAQSDPDVSWAISAARPTVDSGARARGLTPEVLPSSVFAWAPSPLRRETPCGVWTRSGHSSSIRGTLTRRRARTRVLSARAARVLHRAPRGRS